MRSMSTLPSTAATSTRCRFGLFEFDFRTGELRRDGTVVKLSPQPGRVLALLLLLDEYTGVSNTNMHLRAGLGLTARVLVPDPPEWRWMDRGTASPWFPRFRVYRQDRGAGWAGALSELSADLCAAAMAV